MKKKLAMKVCAVAMSLAMVGSLAGCGNNDSGNASGSGSDSQGSTQQPSGGEESSGESESTPDESQQEETYDFGGQVVKVQGNAWENLKEGSDNYDVYWDYAHQIEEKYGVTIEYSPLELDDGYNSTQQIIAACTSGKAHADIFAVSDDGFISLMSGGYLADITKDYNELQVGSLWTDGATWNDHVYGLTFDNMGDSYVMVYSRAYLEEIGMDKTPTDMFVEGKWSYDDCIEYLTEMKSKLPDGTYPISLHYYHWASMAPAANGGIVSVNSNGELGVLDEKYLEALDFYVKLQNQGLAQPMTPVPKEDGTYATEGWSYGTGDTMATATEGKEYVITMAESWQFGGILDSHGEWGVVPWPWGSSVTCDGDYKTLSDNYRTAQSIWTDIVVPAQQYRNASEIPDIVLFKIACDYFDMISPDGANARHSAWEAEQAGQAHENLGYQPGTTRAFCTDQDIEVYDWMHSRVVYDWGHAFDNNSITNIWELSKRIIGVKLDARSVAESYAQEAEANMADKKLK